jgi:predicted Rossmann fold nucleotide-binding protein DprA/Smf involved in DNA uptake
MRGGILMPFTKNEIATYLFCAPLSQTKTPALTVLEWNVVVKSLGENKLQPEALLNMSASNLSVLLTIATTSQKSNILKKVEERQKLSISMLELEDLKNQGYGIMFRSQMPSRLKKLTQKFLPSFFYFAGDPTILLHTTLGVVGARDATSEELSVTSDLVKEAVSQGVVIISGGAKGVDTKAVDTALQVGGKAIIFPSEGLQKWVKKNPIRQYIKNGRLLLMSTQKLDAPFTGSYAMQRNKFIHAPADAMLVASSKISGTKSSGTWEGVLENLKMKWSPIYAIGNSEGVEKLVADGNAKPLTSIEEIFKIDIWQQSNDRNNFRTKLKEAIEVAVTEGIEKETIEKAFTELLAHHFNQIVKISEEKSEETKTQEIIEQLSMENLLKG